MIISGFKSYANQIEVDPFSKSINVVGEYGCTITPILTISFATSHTSSVSVAVGANGSGKSNFFHAIRFVISDITSNNSSEERKQLLHEGAGEGATSAFVELVLDNSDNRWPNDRDEVRIRRTIGIKKDDYTVDRKQVSKSDIKNLLETAGFSHSNPYHVVQQGAITKLAAQKDADRLELLKEIGGTRVYEERRKDSQKLLRDSDGKKAHIGELIEQLDSKLGQLNEEREELQRYQQLDRQRRCLEYTIYDREITTVKSKIESLEAEREESVSKQTLAADASIDSRIKLKEYQKEERSAAEAIEELSRRKAEVTADKLGAITRKTQLEIQLTELEQRTKEGGSSAKGVKEELKRLEKEIGKRAADLEKADIKLRQLEDEESALAVEMSSSQARLALLYAKQGGERTFKSKQERDSKLHKDIKELEKAVATRKSSSATAKAQAKATKAELEKVSAKAGDLEVQLQDTENKASTAATEFTSLAAKRDELQNRQKSLWKQEADLEADMRTINERREAKNKVVEQAVPRDIARGLNSVKRLATQHNIEGVYGSLLENFECRKEWSTAVEVVAGNALFHIIVEDDKVATRLTELLNQERSGRATFMPLNRLQPPNVTYPEQYASSAQPLIKRLTFHEKFKPAYQQIFGKVMLCRDLATATTVSRECGLNCVTPDGDQVERRGALRGGFVDARSSRIEAMGEAKKLESEVRKATKQLTQVKSDLMEVAQHISAAMGELAKLETRQAHQGGATGALRHELRSLRSREEELNRQLAVHEKQSAEMAATETCLRADIETRRALLGTELGAELSSSERKELGELQIKVSRCQEDLMNAKQERLQVSAQAAELQQLLSENLKKRKRDLEDVLANVSGAVAVVDDAELRAARAHKVLLDQEITSILGAESALDKELDKVSERSRNAAKQREKYQDIVDKADSEAADTSRLVEDINTRRSALNLKKSDLERKVRELGSLPADAYEKHRSASAKELHSRLQKVNAELKDFGHVNRKALDQYVNYAEQRDELVRRKSEMDRAGEKIHQLINTLDMRKDEAIERTFKQVARNFRDIFGALVPGGRGDLVMQKRLATAGEENEDPEEDEEGSRKSAATIIEKYCGVKVKVSFGGSGETMSMKQLSGGQRTLVALTLIFSIQRCDPAPFYLFDEVDAALDPAYRSTVADMLRKQTRDEKCPAQFIVTTFHPQSVHVADKIYGVSNLNRISRIDVILQADALQFLSEAELRARGAAHMAMQDGQAHKRHRSLGATGAIEEDDAMEEN